MESRKVVPKITLVLACIILCAASAARADTIYTVTSGTMTGSYGQGPLAFAFSASSPLANNTNYCYAQGVGFGTCSGYTSLAVTGYSATGLTLNGATLPTLFQNSSYGSLEVMVSTGATGTIDSWSIGGSSNQINSGPGIGFYVAYDTSGNNGSMSSHLSYYGEVSNCGGGCFSLQQQSASTSGSWVESTGTIGSPVPLPAAAWLMLGGLGGLGAFARKRRAA